MSKLRIIKYLKAQTPLPQGYTQLEYIQSSGTQYINTYITTKDTHRFDLKFRYITQLSGYNNIMGARSSDGSTSRDQISFARSAGQVWAGWGAQQYEYPISQILLNTDYICSFDKNSFVLNNVVVGTGSQYCGTFENGQLHMYLFCRNQGGTQANMSNSRIYYWKCYEGETLVSNLIPAKNSSNVLGMYDTIRNQFYTNAGSGTFIAGPEVPYSYIQKTSLIGKKNNLVPPQYKEIDYLQSSGTQYIDLGFYANQNYGLYLKYQYYTLSSSYSGRLFGVRTGAGGFNAFGYTGTSAGTLDPNTVFYYSSNQVTLIGETEAIRIDTNIHTLNWNTSLDYRCTFDGVVMSLTGETTAFNHTMTTNMFRAYNNSSYATPAPARIYECSIYNNGHLIHEYVPVKRISDSKVGIYDVIGNEFLTNSGTGDFVAGPEKQIITTYSGLRVIETEN